MSLEAGRHDKTGENSTPTNGEDSTPAHKPQTETPPAAEPSGASRRPGASQRAHEPGSDPSTRSAGGVFLRGFSLQPARPGSGGVIVAPAGPPTPLPYVPAARFGRRTARSASARRSTATTVEFTMLGALGSSSPNLLILQVRLAQTVKQTIISCTVAAALRALG